MRLAIEHVTRYRFSAPVPHGLQRLRLTPKVSAGQRVHQWAITCEGAYGQVEYDDHNNNRVTLVAIAPDTSEVTLRCKGTVDTADNAGIIGEHGGFLPLWHFLRATPLTRPGPKIRALVATAAASGGSGSTLSTLHRLTDAVREAVAYAPGHTASDTTAEAVLAGKIGVCQDHAHVFIAAARAMGVPARYVSGYLMMEDRSVQDAGHAWAEAYVQGLGWVGFDIPNEVCPDARYVRVATGADTREAAPVTGIHYGGAEETLNVELAVTSQRMEQ